jgi:hypothetical protein
VIPSDAVRGSREDRHDRSADAAGWIDRELANARSFPDRRFLSLLEQTGDAVRAGVPMACGAWANTKLSIAFSPVNESANRTFAAPFSSDAQTLRGK